jgi:hypothetical protein
MNTETYSFRITDTGNDKWQRPIGVRLRQLCTLCRAMGLEVEHAPIDVKPQAPEGQGGGGVKVLAQSETKK